jgi:hypothetical protein
MVLMDLPTEEWSSSSSSEQSLCVVLATIFNSQSLHVKVEEVEGGNILLGQLNPILLPEFQIAVALCIATAAVLI